MGFVGFFLRGGDLAGLVVGGGYYYFCDCGIVGNGLIYPSDAGMIDAFAS